MSSQAASVASALVAPALLVRAHPALRVAGASPLPANDGPPRNDAAPAGDVYASFRARLAPLPARAREVVAWRAGAYGDPPTLRAIAARGGFSELRARHLERAALRALRRERPWCDAVAARLRALLPDGALPLDELAGRDPWFGPAVRAPAPLGYLLEHVIGGFAVVPADGEVLVARFDRAAFEGAWRALLAEVRGLDYPAPREDLDAAVHRHASHLGAAAAERLRRRLDAVVTCEGGLVTGCAGSRAEEVAAAFRVAPGPLPERDLHQRFPALRARLPRQLVRVGGGRVAHVDHLEGFAALAGAVASRCVAWMRARGSGRPWAYVELAAMARRTVGDLPAWFDARVLALMLAGRPELRAVRRDAVALRAG